MQFGPVIPADVTAPHIGLAGVAVYSAVFAIVAIATSRRPISAVVALLFLDPFAYYQSIGVTTLTLSKIALAAAIAGLVYRKVPLHALKAAPVARLLLAVLLIAVATALSALHAAFITPVVRETLKWTEYAIILAVCATAFYEDPDEVVIRWGVLVVTAIVVALSIPELYLGAHSGLIIAHTEVPRIAGPLEGPNQLAAYLGLMLPVMLAYTLMKGRRWPEIFVIASGIVATCMSFSRGGLVALALALLLTAFMCARSSAARMVLGTAALAVIAGAGIAWRLVAGGIGLVTSAPHHRIEIHGGLGTRRDLWRAAIELWRAHPIWGIGAGNYELEVGKLLRAPIKTHANSLYLQSLVEGGAPLLAATLFLVYTSVATFVRRAQTPLAVAALAASAALSVHFILDLLVFYPKMGGQWMILLGLAAADLARPNGGEVAAENNFEAAGTRVKH
jgi:O-antigen ligase